MAEKGELQKSRKIKAKDLYKDILIRAAKTGNYWINFKDAHNRANQAKPYAMIHSTNMCTEISIANRPDSTAICTLASINLGKFVK
jgi:ribonucleoside-diphosphate reductase alpha chain